MTKYFIVCASKNHVQRGIEGGFMQANNGKKTSLLKIKTGDRIFYYSSKNFIEDEKSNCQKFTAIGKVKDEELYQGNMGEGFVPWRRNVDFEKEFTEVDIKELLFDLHFIKDTKRWGYPLRFGFLEIDEHDGELLRAKML